MPSNIQSFYHPLTISSAQSQIEQGLNCAHEFQTSIYLFIRLSLFVLLTTNQITANTRRMVHVQWRARDGGWENSENRWKRLDNRISNREMQSRAPKTKCER